MFKYLVFLLAATASLNAYAFEDAASELQGFEAYSDILPGDNSLFNTPKKSVLKQKEIIPAITSKIPEAAAYNIANAEQVFCYEVARREKGYTGYTISSYAIKGYCGELNNSNIVTTYEALFTQGPNLISTPANCRVEPRVMLRFARGVDYTDVLLSLPCPSFAVFYGGTSKAFRIKEGIITDIIEQLETTNVTFNSPTLLKQTVPNGTASNDDELKKLEKKEKELAPQMKWKQPKEKTAPVETPKKSGWSNIKLRK